MFPSVLRTPFRRVQKWKDCFPGFSGLPLGESRSGRILESRILDLSVLVCFTRFWDIPLGGSRSGRILEPQILDLSVLECSCLFPRVLGTSFR